MCWILYVNCMCNVLIFRDTYTIRSAHLIPIMFYFVTPFECRPFVFIILLESSNATHTHTQTRRDAILANNNNSSSIEQRHTHKMIQLRQWAFHEMQAKKFSTKKERVLHTQQLSIEDTYFSLNSIHSRSRFFLLLIIIQLWYRKCCYFCERHSWSEMNTNTIWHDNYKVYVE